MRILGNRILFKPDHNPEVTNGIAKPDYIQKNQQKKVPTGTVAAVGSGSKIPAEIIVGVRVAVDPNYGSTDYDHQGEAYRIVSASDVVAVVGSEHVLEFSKPHFR